MKFGAAQDLMEAGHRVAREGWNGKGMFIYLVPAASYPAQRGAAKRWLGEGAMVPYGAYYAMKTAQDVVVPWLASQTDILAKDWVSIEDEIVGVVDEGSLTFTSVEQVAAGTDSCPAGAQCLSLKCKLDHSAGARPAPLGPNECPYGYSCGNPSCGGEHPEGRHMDNDPKS